MSDNNNRRILAEARALLEKRVEAYTPPARMIYDEPEPEEPFELAPARRQRLDTVSQQPQLHTDWSEWEAWLAARIEPALQEERERMGEIVALALADTVAEALAAEREASAQALRGLKAEIATAQDAVATLRAALDAERARVVDLPNPLQRRDLN